MALVLAFSANHEAVLHPIERRPKHIRLATDLAVFDILLNLAARFVDLAVGPFAAVAALKPWLHTSILTAARREVCFPNENSAMGKVPDMERITDRVEHYELHGGEGGTFGFPFFPVSFRFLGSGHERGSDHRKGVVLTT